MDDPRNSAGRRGYFTGMTLAKVHGLALALVSAAACDAGSFYDVSVTVPAEVADAYSEAERGLLRARFDVDGHGTSIYALGIVCGVELTASFADVGLDGLRETEIHAWIDPLPPRDSRPCGAFDEPIFDARVLTPDHDAPQAATSLAERGGEDADLAVELVLALP